MLKNKRVESILSNPADLLSIELQQSNIMNMIENYTLINVLFAFSETPLSTLLSKGEPVNYNRFVKENKIEKNNFDAVISFLQSKNIIKIDKDEILITDTGKIFYNEATKGILKLIVGGYGNLFKNASELTFKKIVYGVDIKRNELEVAQGSSIVTNNLLDHVPIEVIRSLKVKNIVELACGAGYFAKRLLEELHDHKINLIGLDYSKPAIDKAKEINKGNSARFEVVDCFNLEAVRELSIEVDLFYSFALEHEQLLDGEDKFLSRLSKIAKLFPGKMYLMGEPLPFSPTFKLLHSLSLQGQPRKQSEWAELISKVPNASLKEVFVSEHRNFGAFYLIAFNK